MRPQRMLAFSVPIIVVAVLWGLAAHDPLQSSSAAMSAATVAVTRSAEPSLALPKAVAPPQGEPEFSATFSGTKLNTSVWATCYQNMGSQVGCRNFGNPEESQWYLPSQDRVFDGVLHVVAQRLATQGTASPNGPAEEYGCRSGMISSYPSFKFKYGFVQAVADIPFRPGLWPALWLAAANGAYPPEIDMLESWGVHILTAAYFHPVPKGTFRDRGLIPAKLAIGWQTYSLSWTPSKLTYYVGNQVVLIVTKKVPHQAMYFIANLAEFLKPVAGDCSGQLLIRSVKVWKN